ncbi:hypothetical protein QEN19_001525 [Hanseniaspora menglaensis]
MLELLIDYNSADYLKPKYTFVLVLILIYVDPNINQNLKPTEVDILQFLNETEEFLKFNSNELSDFVSLLESYLYEQSNSKILNSIKNYAISLFFEVLSNINYLDLCLKYFDLFILKKDDPYAMNTHSQEYSKHILLENSVFGSFVICCSQIVKNKLVFQEKINMKILNQLYYFKDRILIDDVNLIAFRNNSNAYKFITNKFNLDVATKKDVLFNINNVLLTELLPSEAEKKYMLHLNETEKVKTQNNFYLNLTTNMQNRNFQFSQDELFKGLDSCESQYQLIMIILAMVHRYLFFNDLFSVVENLTIIIESSRASKNRFLLVLSLTFLYIVTSKYPEIKKYENMKSSILTQLDEFHKDDKLISSTLGSNIYEKFLCGKTLSTILRGEFNKSFDVIREIELLNFQQYNEAYLEQKGSYSHDISIFPLSYNQVLNNFYQAFNCFHLQTNFSSRISIKADIYNQFSLDTIFQSFSNNTEVNFICQNFIKEMYKKVLIDDRRLTDFDIDRLKALETKYDTLIDEYYMIHYIIINNFLILNCVNKAIDNINLLLNTISDDTLLWKFEFDLLKCNVYAQHSFNKTQVLKLFNTTFFDDSLHYYKNLDRYRKLMVQVCFNCFKIESGIENDLTYIV